MRGRELVVKTEQFATTYGYPNQLVTFTALPAEGATPSGFKNARMSEKFTLGYAPYELPAEGAFQSDDRGDCKKSVTVMTDDLGYARAMFYFGNTDNFTYRIEAKIEGQVGDGSSVVFTELIPDYEYFSGYHLYAPNYHYQYGSYNYYLTGAPVEFSVFENRIDPIACVGTSCSYSLTPAEDSFWTWYSWLEGGSPAFGGTVRTDGDGRAGVEVNIPPESTTQYFNLGWDAGTWGIDIQHTVIGVPASDIYFWKMQRRDKNYNLYTLANGGTVQATDLTIELEYWNKLSTYLQLAVTKGGSRLKAKAVPYHDGGYVVNPDWSKIIFYLDHDSNAPPETEFEFILLDPQTGTMFDRKRGNIYFDCTEARVNQELMVMDQKYEDFLVNKRKELGLILYQIGKFARDRAQGEVCVELAAQLANYLKSKNNVCCDARDQWYYVYSKGYLNTVTEVYCASYYGEPERKRRYDPFTRLLIEEISGLTKPDLCFGE